MESILQAWFLALKCKCSVDVTVYSDEMLEEERPGRGNLREDKTQTGSWRMVKFWIAGGEGGEILG